MVRFRSEPWIPNRGPLVEDCFAPLSNESRALSVYAFAAPSGRWHWDRFVGLLPHSVSFQVAVMRPPNDLEPPDHIPWHFSSNGQFSVKSLRTTFSRRSTFWPRTVCGTRFGAGRGKKNTCILVASSACSPTNKRALSSQMFV